MAEFTETNIRLPGKTFSTRIRSIVLIISEIEGFSKGIIITILILFNHTKILMCYTIIPTGMCNAVA